MTEGDPSSNGQSHSERQQWVITGALTFTATVEAYTEERAREIILIGLVLDSCHVWVADVEERGLIVLEVQPRPT